MENDDGIFRGSLKGTRLRKKTHTRTSPPGEGVEKWGPTTQRRGRKRGFLVQFWGGGLWGPSGNWGKPSWKEERIAH